MKHRFNCPICGGRRSTAYERWLIENCYACNGRGELPIDKWLRYRLRQIWYPFLDRFIMWTFNPTFDYCGSLITHRYVDIKEN